MSGFIALECLFSRLDKPRLISNILSLHAHSICLSNNNVYMILTKGCFVGGCSLYPYNLCEFKLILLGNSLLSKFKVMYVVKIFEPFLEYSR